MVSKEELERLYKNHTQDEIADILGVHNRTIRRWFKAYNIKTGIHQSPQFKKKKPKLKKKQKEKLYTDKEDFEKVYKQVKSLPLVAKHYGISHNTALAWKKKHNLPTIYEVSDEGIESINSLKPYTNKDWLEEHYEKYSMPEIAELCGVHRDTIRDWIKRFDIRTKTVKEQRAKKVNYGNQFIYEDFFDKKNYLEIYSKEGNITKRMREYIINKVGKCQCCGYKEVLDLHHKDQNHHNNEPYNLVVLCPNCHARVHRLNENIEDMIEGSTNWFDLI